MPYELLARTTKGLSSSYRFVSRSGFTLIELMLVVIIIGILVSTAVPSLVGAQDRARNASVVSNVNTVRLAVEQYATDFNGACPTASGFPSNMLTGGYLAGNQMPRSPWCSSFQTVSILPAPPLLSAGLALSQPLPSVGIVLESVGRVGSPPSQQRDFGAIVYDYDAGSQVYVIYGVGKKGRPAILAGQTTKAEN